MKIDILFLKSRHFINFQNIFWILHYTLNNIFFCIFLTESVFYVSDVTGAWPWNHNNKNIILYTIIVYN